MSDADDLSPDEDEDPPAADNAANPRQAERKTRRIARERREGEQFWRAALATPVGRRELWRLLAAGFEDSAFACGPTGFPQPEASWFKAGVQDYARKWHDILQILDFNGIYLMRCENDPRFASAPRPVARTDVDG